jgi:transglutaminase-like putative cysteine protease
MIIEVTHLTRFTYQAPVFESAIEARLGPLMDGSQRLLSFELSVQPQCRTFQYVDGFKNRVYCWSVLPPHKMLAVTAVSRIETLVLNPFAEPERAPLAPLIAPAPLVLDRVDAWPYLRFHGPVDCSDGVDQLARRFLSLSNDPLQQLQALMQAIHADYEYKQAATTVTSTVSDVLKLKQGVCQDFAHLMIAVCRAMGLPARYVSGYVMNIDDHETRGGGASHAWCEVWVPGMGWRGFDPTNNVLAAESHAKIALGRDYTDVPPTRGVHRGFAEEQVEVTVTTRRIDTR